MQWFALISTLVVACDSGAPPVTVTTPVVAPAPPDAVLRDAPVARTCNGHLRIAIGELVAPPQWCWRRIEEGDDLSGQLVDDRDQVRAHYTLLAFDERLPNPCARAKPKLVHGIALTVCEAKTGHTCASLDGRVDLCTDSTIAAGFDVATLGEMFVPKP